MIDFSNVSFGYSNNAVTVDEINFHINKGEFVAIIGENGAGKSTVSKLVNGILKPTKGTVTIAGMDTKTARTSKIAEKVGFLFQNPDRQICQKTVREEIRFGLSLVSDKTDEEIDKRVDEVLEQYHFNGDREPFTLSRGQRQLLALCSLVAVAPEVLILDEPTTGLDYRECMDIMYDIKELNKQGVTIVMVCHDMEVVLDFADRVIAMSKGRIVAAGSTHDVFRNQQAMEAANVLPAQIPELAMRLGGDFSEADTPEDIVQCILNKKGGLA